MRYSKDHKAETRQRILKSAARLLREKGLHGVGVVDVMKDAGLTHGGFYAHFKSREELVAEAVGEAMAKSGAHWRKWIDPLPAAERLPAFIDSYLSGDHRDKAGTGCAIPALGGEIAREGRKARTVLSGRVEELIDLIASEASDGAPDERKTRAIGALATMVGAVVLSRLAGRGQRSDDILDIGRSVALETMTATPARKPRKPRAPRKAVN